VTVYPGLELVVTREAADQLHVRAAIRLESPDDGFVELEGWLPARNVDQVYTPAQSPRALPAGTPRRIVRPIAVSLTAGGAPIAQIEARNGNLDLAVVALGNAQGSLEEIAFDAREATVRGFVPANALTAVPGQRAGWSAGGWGSGFGRSHTERVVVKRGACAYDAADGEAIGVFKLTDSDQSLIPPVGARFRSFHLPHRARAWVRVADAPVSREKLPRDERPLDLARGAWSCAQP
jgi:hypothetical protein